MAKKSLNVVVCVCSVTFSVICTMQRRITDLSGTVPRVGPKGSSPTKYPRSDTSDHKVIHNGHKNMHRNHKETQNNHKQCKIATETYVIYLQRHTKKHKQHGCMFFDCCVFLSDVWGSFTCLSPVPFHNPSMAACCVF